jgi:hypothetical protein
VAKLPAVTNHRDWRIIEIHKRLRKLHGPPTVCEHCGKTENLEYANISKEYSDDISDYKQLCRSCHRLYDYIPTTHCGNGHKYVKENTAIRVKEGRRESRICLDCRKNDNDRRRLRNG